MFLLPSREKVRMRGDPLITLTSILSPVKVEEVKI